MKRLSETHDIRVKQTSHVHSQSVRTAVCAAYTWVKPCCYQWPFGVPAQNA